MEKNTMIFLIIILLIAFVVGYLFWKSYEDKTAKTTEYDPSVAWANSAASMTQSVGNVFSNIFGGRR